METDDGFAERAGIPGRDEQTGLAVAHDVPITVRASARGDDRLAHGHGLVHDQGARLEIDVLERHDDELRSVVQVAQAAVVEPSLDHVRGECLVG